MSQLVRGISNAGLLFQATVLLLAWPAASFCHAQPPAPAEAKAANELPRPFVPWASTAVSPVPFTPPPSKSGLRVYPIDLPTALELANAQALDIRAASARVKIAEAQLNQAKVSWLPSITVGGDYFHHDGENISSAGQVVDSSYSSLMFGAGPGLGSTAILSFSDSYFGPLAARQVLRARRADLEAAANDTLQTVAEAYFNVQQARGELAGALAATRRSEDLVRRMEKLAPGLVPPVEAVRSQAELALRKQAEVTARERWRVASAELIRVLRLDATTQVEPVEPPHLRVDLVRLDTPIDDLIPMALTLRPELDSQQALVQASLQRLRLERLRPLIPSILIRGNSTNPGSTLIGGLSSGGGNSTLGDFSGRVDVDVQLLWQFDNLGFGNRAKTQQRRAENQAALIDLFRTEDRVAAEVSEALAQAQSATERVGLAEQGLRLAVESADKNLAGISETQRAGDLVILVVRPQEAVAAVEALAQAYLQYYGAVGDVNRAQFRLYRALGKPASLLLDGQDPRSDCPPKPAGR
jgi:outer membrane protein TolC